MSALQPGSSFTRQRGFTVAMIAVCLVLLAFLAVCQVAHVHSSISEADHCALCVVLHSAVPVTAAAAAVIVLVPLGSPAPVLETRAAIRRWLPTLFIRPPPMGW